MNLDEKQLREDLNSPAFKVGQFKGRWQFAELKFPILFTRVAAPQGKPGPGWFLLRIECSNYPGVGPTAQLWDARTDTALAESLRPQGREGVLKQFSTWGTCLYHPIDRIGQTHWPGQFPDYEWKSSWRIPQFLEIVHGLINDPAYLQSLAPAAAAEHQSQTLEAAE